MQAWENVYVFISSTFNDMHAERDYLVKRVFPELAAWCEERRLRLVDIDLRWGVTEKDSQENKRVVDVCLRNIDRCRPLFLCFLGQRRGWVPAREDISDGTFEGFPKLEAHLGSSVTEMEVLHALIDPMMNGSVLELANRERAFFFLRDPGYLEDLADQHVRNVYTNEAEVDSAFADQKLAAFKERVRATGRPAMVYEAAWDPSARTPELLAPGKPEGIDRGRLTGFHCADRDLADVVIEQMQAAISELYPGREAAEAQAASSLQRELDEQAAFQRLASEGFIERAGDFDAIRAYLNGADARPCALVAQAGFGKTSFFARLIGMLVDEGEGGSGNASCLGEYHEIARAHEVIYRFVGTSEGSVSVASLLASIGEELSSRFGLKNVPAETQKLREALPELFDKAAQAAGKQLIVLIDAVNQLDTALEDLTWIPAFLAGDVKFVYSFKLGDPVGDVLRDELEHSGEARVLELRGFESRADREALVEQYLSLYLKELDTDKLEAIVSSSGAGNPLFLKVLLSELRVSGSHDRLREQIDSQFGHTPLEAFDGLLNRLEGDPLYSAVAPRDLATNVFGWLSHARNGLQSDELAGLLETSHLAPDTETARDAVNLVLRQLRPYLAKRDKRHDFFYESFLMAARERYEAPDDGCAMHADASSARPLTQRKSAAAWHRELAAYFETRHMEDPRRLQELAYQYAHAGMSSELSALLTSFEFMEARLRSSGVQALIGDYVLAALPQSGLTADERAQFALVREALEMAAPILSQDATQLPVQLFGRLLGFDQPLIVAILNDADRVMKARRTPWLKPLAACLPQPGGRILRYYKTGESNHAQLFSDRRRMLINIDGEQSVKIVEIATGRLLRTYPLGHTPRWLRLIEEHNVFAFVSSATVHLVNLTTGESRAVRGIDSRTIGSLSIVCVGGGMLVSKAYAAVGKQVRACVNDIETGELLHTFDVREFDSDWEGYNGFSVAYDHETGYLLLSIEERGVTAFDPKDDFRKVRRYSWSDEPLTGFVANRVKTGPKLNWTYAPKGTPCIMTLTQYDGITVYDKRSGEALFHDMAWGIENVRAAFSRQRGLFATLDSRRGKRGLCLYDFDTFERVASYETRDASNAVLHLEFSQDGSRLHIGWNDGLVEVRDTSTWEVVDSLKVTHSSLRSVWEGVHDVGLVTDFDNQVVVWRNECLTPGLADVRDCFWRTDKVALAPDGTFFLSWTVMSFRRSTEIMRFELPSMEFRAFDVGGWEEGPFISCDSRHFMVICQTTAPGRKSAFKVMRFFDCATGLNVGEIELIDTTGTGHPRAIQNRDYRFVPEEARLGPRNLTVLYRQWGNLVMQDPDAPDATKVIPVFPGEIMKVIPFDGGMKVALRSSNHRFDPDSAKDFFCRTKDESLPEDETEVIDLCTGECIEHHESYAEWKETSIRIGELDDYPVIEALLRADLYYDLEDIELCRVQGRMLCHLRRDEENSMRQLVIRDAWRRDPLCWYTGDEQVTRLSRALCTHDGKYVVLTEGFVFPFSLENVFDDGCLPAIDPPSVAMPVRFEGALNQLAFVLSHKADMQNMHEAYLAYSELAERFPKRELHAKNRGIVERRLKGFLDEFGRTDDVGAVERWFGVYRDLDVAHPGDAGFAELSNYAEDKLAFGLSHRKDVESLERAAELYAELIARGYAEERNATNLRITRAHLVDALRDRGIAAEDGVDDLQRAYDLVRELASEYPDRESYLKSERNIEHKLAYSLIIRHDSESDRRAYELYADLAAKDPGNEVVAKNLRIVSKRLGLQS